MPVAILSPHPDDAVLSCWHQLCGPGDARVIDLFAGTPEHDEPSWWDTLTGAAGAGERAAERLQEDASALSLAGRRAHVLDFPDATYRCAPLSVERVVDVLRLELDPGEVLLAPADLGLHPDHALALLVALELGREGWTVELYADLPHAIVFGWPSWITGVEPEPGLDVARLWEHQLRQSGLDVESLEPTVHELNGQAEAKAQAFRAYRTQAPALARLMPADGLRYEVTWALRP